MVFLFGVVLFVGVVLLVVGSTIFSATLNLVVEPCVTPDEDSFLTQLLWPPLTWFIICLKASLLTSLIPIFSLSHTCG